MCIQISTFEVDFEVLDINYIDLALVLTHLSVHNVHMILANL